MQRTMKRHSLTAAEQNSIFEMGKTLSGPVRIILRRSGKAQDEMFDMFCKELSGISPKFQIDRKAAEANQDTALLIGSRLSYHAIPAGKELPPFLDALGIRDGAETGLPASIKKTLSALHLPSVVNIHIAPQCPFCPSVVREIIPLALVSDRVRVAVIDSVMFPGTSKRQKIQSVPTVVLDDRMRWTGVVAAGEVVRMMLNRDPSELSAISLKNMIENGEAIRVSRMMVESGQIFPALISLLVDEKWSVRLGAMVVMEMIADEDKVLAAEVIEPLWEQFHGASDPVRGDILHVFGETGHSQAVEMIQTVINSEYAGDVVESAEEALFKCNG